VALYGICLFCFCFVHGDLFADPFFVKWGIIFGQVEYEGPFFGDMMHDNVFLQEIKFGERNILG